MRPARLLGKCIIDEKENDVKLTAEDQLELLQLQHLYGHVLDAFLWDKLDEVFAPDGVFDPSDVGLPVMRGIDEIREKLIPIVEGENKEKLHNHIGTNPAIVGFGENGIVKMRCKYIIAGERDYLSFGEYLDDCIKTDKGWRFLYRKTKRITAYTVQHIKDAPRYTPEDRALADKN